MEEKKAQKEEQKIQSQKEKFVAIAKYSALGFQMVAIILLFVFIGLQLDDYFETSVKWFTLIGTILGFLLSLYYSLKDFFKL